MTVEVLDPEEPAVGTGRAAAAPRRAAARFAGFEGARQLALLGASFALVMLITVALAWSIGPAPDEDSHAFMAAHQAHSLTSPGWEDMRWGTDRGHSYYLYSPAPYYVYAPFQWVQEAVGPVTGASQPDRFITRLGGVLVFAPAQLALTIWMVRRMSRSATGEAVILVAFAVNLVPQLRYLHAYLNTDAYTILASTACFAVGLRLWDRARIGVLDAALVGGALAAVAHGRYNGFVAAGLLGVGFGVCLVGRVDGLRLRLRLAGVAIALPLLLAAPVHLAISQELRNDHVVASTDHDELARSTFFARMPKVVSSREQVDALFEDAPGTWRSMWGQFQAYFERPPVIWTWTLVALCLVGAVGLALQSPALLERRGRGIGMVAVGATALTWLLMISWPYHLGRFLLPAAMTALMGIVLGGGVVVQRVTHRAGLLVSAGAWILVLGAVDVAGLLAVRG